VVDDSATARAIISEILKSSLHVESIDTAPDAFVARDKIVKNRPDVICLDVEMPRMDGITFLRKLMKHMPIPVIMVSSLTTKGAKTTLDALEAGAIDFVAKPHSNIYEGKSEIEKELIEKVIVASKSKPLAMTNKKKQDTLTYHAVQTTTQKIVAIGSSTGGTEAIKEVLTKLPANSPSVIIVQHMPASFTKQFAQRLNELCKVEVKEAQSGDSLGIGQVFIAPGEKHMVLRRSGTRYYLEIGGGEKVSGHKPSVDVLFNSVAKVAGENAMGVILTGMGSDGAKGLLKLRQSGAITLGQDEKSCVVYGMPKVAFGLGAVCKEVSIENMSQEILNTLEEIKE
jgi:two-component system chemotaxis response regulator CheB